MHVLHLETGRPLYGGPRQVLLLMAGLGSRGVRSTLVCPADSAIGPAARDLGLAVVPVPFRGDLDLPSVPRLARVIRAQQADLLHVHSRRGADLFGGMAARLAGVPAVLTRRVDRPEPQGIGRIRYRPYRRVVGISSAVAAQLQGQVPEGRLRVIPSAVDAAACQPTWSLERFRVEFGLPPDGAVAGVVAQLIPRKGHELLLEAWRRVRERNPSAHLLVFGTGPLEPVLRTWIAPDDGVILAGFRADLRAFLGHLDVLAHPAVREGLGVAVLEAQAAGVPVVAVAAGGVPEVVEPGSTGLLVAPGDTAGLASALERLLADAGLRRQMGAAARQRMATRFTPAAMVDGYVALYREILGPAGNS